MNAPGTEPQEPTPPSDQLRQRAQDAVRLLQEVLADRAILAHLDDETRKDLLQAAGRVARPDPWQKRELWREMRRQRKAQKRAADEAKLSETGIRKLRKETVFVTPPPLPAPVGADVDIDRALAEPRSEAKTVLEERSCYVCKATFTTLHHFYDSMCGKCGDFNYHKRQQTADLRGRTAVVTGSRVKIGYQASILMLRAGCSVIATTRFPHDSAMRYAREPDFEAWKDRLFVHGLDLRHTPGVEAFCRHLNQTQERLDFIINNACQTVRRPVGFYRHLMDLERQPLRSLPAGAQDVLRSHELLRCRTAALADGTAMLPTAKDALRLHDAPELSQKALLQEDLVAHEGIFPGGRLDQDLQQIDLRTHNSWRMPLAEVTTVELLEVQLVNAVAPFVLNAQHQRLEPTRDKHIVNVSAMEGQFYRAFKTDKHPHTNMAKAALNMMTRTSARDYVQDGIHMNSVDTGWVTDEDPAEIAARKVEEHGFHPPLDIVDGAARIVDPIFEGFRTGVHVWGQFLKDYRPTHW